MYIMYKKSENSTLLSGGVTFALMRLFLGEIGTNFILNLVENTRISL